MAEGGWDRLAGCLQASGPRRTDRTSNCLIRGQRGRKAGRKVGGSQRRRLRGVQGVVAGHAAAELSPGNKRNCPLTRTPLDLGEVPEHLLNCSLAPRLKREEAPEGSQARCVPRREAEVSQREEGPPHSDPRPPPALRLHV